MKPLTHAVEVALVLLACCGWRRPAVARRAITGLHRTPEGSRGQSSQGVYRCRAAHPS